MILISSPICIKTDGDPEAELVRIQQFLGAEYTERDKVGPKIQDFYLVGPQVSENVSHILKRLHVNFDLLDDDSQALGWGIWMPGTVRRDEAPLVQTFKHLPHLADRPVMVSEYSLQAGELIVVTRDSESFVVLTSVNDDPIPSAIRWFRWSTTKTNGRTRKQNPAGPEERKPAGEPESPRVAGGRVIHASRPWLTDLEPTSFAPLTAEQTSFQLTPMLDRDDAIELACQVANGPWARRIGDIYTQDALDIVSWSKEKDCPDIVKRVVELVHDPRLPLRVAGLTNIPVESLREMFAYRLRGGDRILVHADSTFRGQLMVRANWLLQAPSQSVRRWDFRFWRPGQPDTPTVVYSSLPNRAVFFLFGENNSHDVPMVPVGDTDRVNIVISFGKAMEF